MKDHQGREVPADEPPDKIIKVWQIRPAGEFDEIWVRGWQDMLECAEQIIEHELEDTDEVSLKIKLVEITRADYDAASEESYC